MTTIGTEHEMTVGDLSTFKVMTSASPKYYRTRIKFHGVLIFVVISHTSYSRILSSTMHVFAFFNSPFTDF